MNGDWIGSKTMNNKYVAKNQIAIDGSAASGKSIIGKIIAERLNWKFLSSGKIYRSITAFWCAKIIPNSSVDELANRITISIKDNNILINGQQFDNIFTPAITQAIGEIANNAKIRQIINRAIRSFASVANVVVEGRDITSVVLPNAAVKLYIDADVNVRAQRRWKQLNDNKLSLAEIIDQLTQRDEQDKNRLIAPLKIVDDAIVIDTTHLTLPRTITKIMRILVKENKKCIK